MESNMRVLERSDNIETMLSMYAYCWAGVESVIRGQKCRNVRNMAVILDPSKPVLTSFQDRKLNLKYAKEEWLWYLRADRFDTSIEQHATMWAKLRQPDGSYYSNYGQYIFADDVRGQSQFDYVLETLTDDTHSRRASMVLLNRYHLFKENSDVVCTYAINFTIEYDELHMTVMMRSNDVIFGFTNDSFCFWQLYQLMFAALEARKPGLKRGTYTHFTNSMHVYERHYDMIRAIIGAGALGYTPIDVPTPTYDEAMRIVRSNGKDLTGDYGTWLKN